MFKIDPSREQVEYTENLLKTTNFGRRGDGSKDFNNGTPEKQYRGILGQTVMADFLHQSRPKQTNEADHGIDFIINGVKIDVKVTSRCCDPGEDFVNNVCAEQMGDYYENDVYLFLSYNTTNGSITVCGWVTKEYFKNNWDHHYVAGEIVENNSDKFPVNGEGLYDMLNTKLNKFKCAKEFKDAMFELSKQL